jgi:hypothetical protein
LGEKKENKKPIKIKILAERNHPDVWRQVGVALQPNASEFLTSYYSTFSS